MFKNSFFDYPNGFSKRLSQLEVNVQLDDKQKMNFFAVTIKKTTLKLVL